MSPISVPTQVIATEATRQGLQALINKLGATDNRPEAERLARELRKRLETARHRAEDWEEAAGRAAHARYRADAATGKAKKKWSRKADKLEAQAAGYERGLEIIYSELAVYSQ